MNEKSITLTIAAVCMTPLVLYAIWILVKLSQMAIRSRRRRRYSGRAGYER